MAVDHNGCYSQKFQRGVQVKFKTYYKGFFSVDTLLDIQGGDTIHLDFIVQPKVYSFSAQSALEEVDKGRLSLITFDTAVYNWSLKFDYTKQFGFTYLFQQEPADREFRDKMHEYNYEMGKWLDLRNGPEWETKVFLIEDSLRYLEADNYGKTHLIDFNTLVFSADTLPPAMQHAIKEQAKLYKLFADRAEAPVYTEAFMLGKIDTSSDYNYVATAEYWLVMHYEKMIPELIRRLTDKREVGLANTADLIIMERIQSGDLEFYGHGGVAYDDLFTVAGRANHLLKTITGEDFGSVSMYSTAEDLKKLQNRWVWWLMELNKR
jgi:hypothetical protein